MYMYPFFIKFCIKRERPLYFNICVAIRWDYKVLKMAKKLKVKQMMLKIVITGGQTYELVAFCYP